MSETFRLPDHPEALKQLSNNQSFEKSPGETAFGMGYRSTTHIGTG